MRGQQAKKKRALQAIILLGCAILGSASAFPWNGFASLSSQGCGPSTPRVLQFVPSSSSTAAMSSPLNSTISRWPGFNCSCINPATCCATTLLCDRVKTHDIGIHSSLLRRDDIGLYSVLVVANGTLMQLGGRGPIAVDLYGAIRRSSLPCVVDTDAISIGQVLIGFGQSNYTARIDTLGKPYVRACVHAHDPRDEISVMLIDFELTFYFLY